MRVFAYEYTCGSGQASTLSLALRKEGWAMLAALLDDLRRSPGVEPITMLDASLASSHLVGQAFQPDVRHLVGQAFQPDVRLESLTYETAPLAGGLAGVAIRDVQPGEEHRILVELAASADYTLLIAPECGGLLHERCRWVEEVGGRLLGPGSAAVGLTGDKYSLSEHLRSRGVPTPPCTLLAGKRGRSSFSVLPAAAGRTENELRPLFPAVCKPRDGAGSQATFLVRRAEDLPLCLAQAAAEGWLSEMVLQPFVPGEPASVSFLIGPGACLPLVPAAQYLSNDGRFHYRGGRLPLPANRAARAVDLGRRAIEAVPGLHGYVGIDLVLGSAVDGSGDQVIEINPRLTTSYLGLRALARDNLAEIMLRLALGEVVTHVSWREAEVEF
jgi:predicted ATP-grasp superfamily ATP-dependent carboligase